MCFLPKVAKRVESRLKASYFTPYTLTSDSKFSALKIAHCYLRGCSCDAFVGENDTMFAPVKHRDSVGVIHRNSDEVFATSGEC